VDCILSGLRKITPEEVVKSTLPPPLSKAFLECFREGWTNKKTSWYNGTKRLEQIQKVLEVRRLMFCRKE
jgi:hypothetical protein